MICFIPVLSGLSTRSGLHAGNATSDLNIFGFEILFLAFVPLKDKMNDMHFNKTIYKHNKI